MGRSGLGEVAPIDRLSPESPDEVPDQLALLGKKIVGLSKPSSVEDILGFVQEHVPITFPSIRCGMETALLDLHFGGEKSIFVNDKQAISIPINGLIWMGDLAFMRQQIAEKLDQGFNCIKLKVGSLDFEDELTIIKNLRKVSDDLVIRLDANGGFAINKVLSILSRLNKYRIHSIEQPILPMQPEAMELICRKSEIPIALDEELIHVFSLSDKMELLQELRPQYIVLKPTLHGGFSGTQEWIDLAQMHGISWWVTSYLESNLGLNAIAQFASQFKNEMHHGLGTGHLYHNNLESPVIIAEGFLKYAKSNVWGEVF